ncbi:GDP-mannose 4,6-dehydratase [Spirulina subsalsa FACHB-351]|uniref:GDP-mannose 4,6-dehydratase n=1 Tax=Spirulina subsalsa FACHB-351 TaxID=234711 RepID=A0ABT3L8R8_9CYAN|nr:GDP-mannose 4,6-dehydratase [Spirulina subsalsa]MCW6037906.1 GDP-mannose 4,6-dehydratase [Spirulina subsalsa FACHB-351]
MRAIIVGHSGQDGTLLYQSLQEQGYTVLGFSRSSICTTDNHCSKVKPNINDIQSIYALVEDFKPSEIYYLPAYHTSSECLEESSIKISFDLAQETHVTGLLNFLCVIRDIIPSCKLFYASSSLIFSGKDGEVQVETTPLSPQGFYGITKAQGMWLCQEFRDRFGIFASVGILYNHESHLRPHHFLSQKIIQAAIRIASGSSEQLVVGDLSARVDWGYAPDFIQGFQKILKLEQSGDFIIASGRAHSVSEFAEITFKYFGLDFTNYIIEDSSILARRSLTKIGDPSKLKLATNWECSFDFIDLIKQLIKESQNSTISR